MSNIVRIPTEKAQYEEQHKRELEAIRKTRKDQE